MLVNCLLCEHISLKAQYNGGINFMKTACEICTLLILIGLLSRLLIGERKALLYGRY